MTEKDAFIGAEFMGTKEVSENLKFDQGKFQQWVDANIQSSGKYYRLSNLMVVKVTQLIKSPLKIKNLY